MIAVQMGNLRGLLGIRRMDRVPNAWIKELCRVRKGLNQRIDEGFPTVVRPCGEDGEEYDRQEILCRRVCW